MFNYDQATNKLNKTPKGDPKRQQNNRNYHPSVHSPMCQKHTHPQCKSFLKYPACVIHHQTDKSAAGWLRACFMLAKELEVRSCSMWLYLSSQAILSPATMLSLYLCKRPRVQYQITSTYCCCLISYFQVSLNTVGSPFLLSGTILDCCIRSQYHSGIPPWLCRSYPRLDVAGCQRKAGSCTNRR